MRNLIPIILPVFLLAGCGGITNMLGGEPLAIFNEVIEKGKNIEDKTFDAAADAIDRYCEAVPESARLYLRQEINKRTKHSAIVVACE